MTQQFAAEILFPNADSVMRAKAALCAVSCICEIDSDLRDPAGMPYVWTMVSGKTELEDEDDVRSWLVHIVGPFEGDVIEWGFGPPWKIRD